MQNILKQISYFIFALLNSDQAIAAIEQNTTSKVYSESFNSDKSDKYVINEIRSEKNHIEKIDKNLDKSRLIAAESLKVFYHDCGDFLIISENLRVFNKIISLHPDKKVGDILLNASLEYKIYEPSKIDTLNDPNLKKKYIFNINFNNDINRMFINGSPKFAVKRYNYINGILSQSEWEPFYGIENINLYIQISEDNDILKIDKFSDFFTFFDDSEMNSHENALYFLAKYSPLNMPADFCENPKTVFQIIHSVVGTDK